MFTRIIALEDLTTEQRAHLMTRSETDISDLIDYVTPLTERVRTEGDAAVRALTLEFDGRGVGEFLLVPYFGACIHVPPPPPNQVVFGAKEDGIKISLFDAIWVYGTLQIETINSDLAESGYSMKVDKMTPLDWKEFMKKK